MSQNLNVCYKNSNKIPNGKKISHHITHLDNINNRQMEITLSKHRNHFHPAYWQRLTENWVKCDTNKTNMHTFV